MDDSLSPHSHGPPVRCSERIDEACDHFEADWRKGRMARIEDYLAEAKESDRSALLRELVELELELRRSRGERPEPGE
jgi:eukaryotic-like serine/threonine-protein kinase